MFKIWAKIIFFLIILFSVAIIIYKNAGFAKYSKLNILPSQYTNNRTITIPKDIWLHQVNNRKKLKYYLNKYTGFEIDVHFNIDKKYFNVSHDDIDGAENLADMLKNINTLKDKYLWLDFKNLSHENKNFALFELNRIVDENNLIKEHIIVESNEPDYLNIFKQTGYYTSFYLNCYSYYDIDEFPKSLSQDIQELEKSDVDFVSSDAHYFDVVKYFFPKIAHLFWYDEPNKDKIKHFFKDKNTYIVLED